MPSILCVGPDLAWPAAVLDGFVPGWAGEHLGAFQFVNRRVGRFVGDLDGLAFAADIHGQRAPFVA